jgi:ATP-dependent DNA ligase
LTRTLAFDVLALDGPVIDRPYAKRRALLERLELHGSACCAALQLRVRALARILTF